MSDTAQSPFAPAPAAQSPFASQPAAQPASQPASAPSTADYGDTSFLDNTSTREPLLKSGQTVPGVISVIEAKKNAESGKQSVFIAVQLYGDKMVTEHGDPVPQGKRLTTTIFAPLDTPEKRERSERKLKALLLALNNVPVDGKTEIAAYREWPPAQKLGLLPPSPEHGRPTPEWSFHALLPPDKWVGTKVLVQVTVGKDMDGVPRNEFNLLASSTKAAERKAK